MQRNIIIYGLFDPRTKIIRYVGKTVNAANRLIQHRCSARNQKGPKRLCRWIAKLEREGYPVQMRLLETVPEVQWAEAEQRWIDHYTALNPTVMLNLWPAALGNDLRDMRRGEDAPAARLTEAQVITIRQKRADGAGVVPLAQEYGLNAATISSVCRGMTWAHVSGPLTTDRTYVPPPRHGEAHHGAKLTEGTVELIRELYAQGDRTGPDLAKQFAISQAAIDAILKGRTWRNAGGPINLGNLHPRPQAKLSGAQAQEARERYRDGTWSPADIAERYGIGYQMARHLLQGRTYTDAGGPITATVPRKPIVPRSPLETVTCENEKCRRPFPARPARSRRFCSAACSIGSRERSDPVARFWAKVERGDGCWNWTGATREGTRAQFRPQPERSVVVQRYSWELTYGIVPDEAVVVPACGNPWCVRPEHLKLSTWIEEIQRDRHQHERRRIAGLPRGTAHHRAKLTEADVAAIRVAVRAGESAVSVSRRYPVGPDVIRDIYHCRIWKHVP